MARLASSRGVAGAFIEGPASSGKRQGYTRPRGAAATRRGPAGPLQADGQVPCGGRPDALSSAPSMHACASLKGGEPAEAPMAVTRAPTRRANAATPRSAAHAVPPDGDAARLAAYAARGPD